MAGSGGSGGRGGGRNSLYNLATWLILVASIVYFGFGVLRKQSSPEYAEAEDLHGVSVAGLPYMFPAPGERGDSLQQLLGPTGTVLYIFTQSCRYCIGQREHIADLLRVLDPSSVLTMSLDPPDSVVGYWYETMLEGRTPVGIHPGVARELQLNRVPMLLVVNERGIVTAGLHGPLTDWTPVRFREYAQRALRITGQE